MQDFDSNVKERYDITHLEHFAANSWNIEEKKLGINMQTITWELFHEHFHERFLSKQWQQQRADEFHDFRQGIKTMVEYEHKFFELMSYVGISDSSPLMIQHFIKGLNANIIGDVKVFQPKTLKDAILEATVAKMSVTLGQGGLPGVQARGSPCSGASRDN